MHRQDICFSSGHTCQKSTVIQMTPRQWYTLEYPFASTATPLETGHNSCPEITEVCWNLVLSTCHYLLHAFLSIFPLQCCKWMEGHLQGAEITASSPSPSVMQAAFVQWERQRLGSRGQLCLLSFPSFHMDAFACKSYPQILHEHTLN